MDQLLQKLRQYLISLNIAVKNIKLTSFTHQLPLFVTAPYKIYTGTVLQRNYVLAVAANDNMPAPEQIAIQKNELEEFSNLPVLFVFQDASKEFCRILISKCISFVIPGKQCFMPGDMILLKEANFSLPGTPKRTKLSPQAQMMFLSCLQENKEGEGISFQDLISRFDLNKVYVSRAAKELESFKLAEIRSNGRSKSLFITHDRKVLWEKAQDFLTTPVHKKIRVKTIPANLPVAGISALAEYSNLNDDSVKTFAVYKKAFDVDGDY